MEARFHSSGGDLERAARHDRFIRRTRRVAGFQGVQRWLIQRWLISPFRVTLEPAHWASSSLQSPDLS